MLLFKAEHVPMILSGRKTQTRRLWPKGKRVNVGSVQQARTRMLDASSTFARLHVKRVWQERLGDISDADAQAEGYADAGGYLLAFCRINRVERQRASGLVVWCVEFAKKEGA